MPKKLAPRGKQYGSPLKAIREHCIGCMGGESWKAVELCPCPECKLWPFRYGIGTDSARAKGKIIDPENYKYVEGD